MPSTPPTEPALEPKPEPLRPADLALLQLAAADGPPRDRARDQQADLAGLGLTQRVLQAVMDLDPEPADLEEALAAIVARFGPPEGPTRSVCALLRDEWQAAQAQPQFGAWLLSEALAAGSRPEGQRRRRRNRPDAP